MCNGGRCGRGWDVVAVVRIYGTIGGVNMGHDDDIAELRVENERLRTAIKKVIRHFKRSGIIGPLTMMLETVISERKAR